MSATSRVGTAVAAGYVLGRFKKLRLAVLAGTALANKQVRDAGLGLIRQGSGQVPDFGSGQNGLGRKLLDEARSAATAVAASRMDSISDRLHERTVALGGGSEESDQSDDPEDEYDDQADEGQDEYDDSEDEYDEDSDEEYDEDEEPEDSGDEHRSSRRRRAAAPAGGR